MNKDKVLITGAGGMVGSYINYGVRLDKEGLDVSDLAAVMKVCREIKPEVIIHLAAYNDLAAAEGARAPQAYMVNAVGTFNMAVAAREIGALLVYVSTSGVFDGTAAGPNMPGDTPNPVNMYGRTKYLGELAVQGACTEYLIVRTSWVFGGGPARDKKFVGKLLTKQDTEPIRAVTDRHGSPTYAKDLVGAIEKLVDTGARGVVHVGGARASRFDVAKEVVAVAGLHTEVLPAVADDFPTAYPTGLNESMEQSPYMRPWQEGLVEYVKTEWKR